MLIAISGVATEIKYVQDMIMPMEFGSKTGAWDWHGIGGRVDKLLEHRVGRGLRRLDWSASSFSKIRKTAVATPFLRPNRVSKNVQS